MNRHFFGTDGIRGPVGRGPLVPGFVGRLGRLLGEEALGETAGRPLALLARDTRASGPAITAALATGLIEAGIDTLDLGVLPTAALPVAMRARDARLGLVISASHNPWRDNGIKVFAHGGWKLDDAREAALEAKLGAVTGAAPGDPGAHAGDDDAAASARPGQAGWPARPARLREEDGAEAYIRWMVRRFSGVRLDGLRLVVDCANGAACVTAPAVLRALGAEVEPVFDRPDGRNINEGCGSTHMGALAAAIAHQVEAGGHVDAGLAFDGDADRVLLVAFDGRTCDGDHMLGFLGAHLASRHLLPGNKVVATVMSNLGLAQMLKAHGVELVRCPVGDRHVLAAMREGGHVLGGEASGHVLVREGDGFIGDGLFTALHLLESMRESGTRLVEVIDSVPHVPQVLVNVKVADRPPVETLAGLQAAVREAEAAHGGSLRILLRYSGTENLARVMVEGSDGALVRQLADRLAKLWAEEIVRHRAGAAGR